MTETNLDNEISAFLIERLNMKRSIHDKISADYPFDVGTTFGEYGNKIKSLYGNDISGYTAADALYCDRQQYIYVSWNGTPWNSAVSRDAPIVGYLTYLNARNRSTDVSFPGITVLSVDSTEKFKFWFIGDGVSSVTFPDLSVLAVGDDFRYPDYNKSRIFKGVQLNTPNLRYVSDRLLPRETYWLSVYTGRKYSSSLDWKEEVDESCQCIKYGPEVVSANFNSNYPIERIPDDFVFPTVSEGAEE